jgi:hypothetical protein
VPLVAFLVVPPIRWIARELAAVRLLRGPAFWTPETGAPLREWLNGHPGRIRLRTAAVTPEQVQRLQWRLYRLTVPVRLRRSLESTLPPALAIRPPPELTPQGHPDRPAGRGNGDGGDGGASGALTARDRVVTTSLPFPRCDK